MRSLKESILSGSDTIVKDANDHQKLIKAISDVVMKYLNDIHYDKHSLAYEVINGVEYAVVEVRFGSTADLVRDHRLYNDLNKITKCGFYIKRDGGDVSNSITIVAFNDHTYRDWDISMYYDEQYNVYFFECRSIFYRK